MARSGGGLGEGFSYNEIMSAVGLTLTLCRVAMEIFRFLYHRSRKNGQPESPPDTGTETP